VTAPPDIEEPESVDTAWDERPIVGNSRGLPWWAAVLLAFAVAAIAAWIDIHRSDSLGRIYQGAYVLGCVLAVCAVRRRNLFGPMVQPPLVFAITAVGAVVLSLPGPVFSTGFKQLLFSVALPLTSNFPTMAITTGVTVAIGLARLWFQRDPNPQTRSNRRAADPEPLASRDSRRSAEPGRTRERSPRPDRATRAERPRVDRDPPAGAPTRDRERRRNRVEPPAPERQPRADRTRGTPPPERRRRQPSDPPPRRQPGSNPRRRPPDDYR
jgi:hypothetical protein